MEFSLGWFAEPIYLGDRFFFFFLKRKWEVHFDGQEAEKNGLKCGRFVFLKLGRGEKGKVTDSVEDVQM